ncbi:MAG: membrane protease subunit HflK [Alphaproteobacteria bacterium]|jgi:membrane protease subunit HflK
MANNPWDGGPKNPWGGNNNPNNNNSNNNNSNNTPPDFEQIIIDAKNRFKQKLPPGSGGGWVIGLLGVAACVGWLTTGFYHVKTGEQGVVLQFGKYLKTTTSGLNYHLPYPIQQKILVDMELNRNVNVGRKNMTNNQSYARNTGIQQQQDTRKMLTGDENILNVDFDVRWKVSNAADYLFKVNDPEQTVGAVSESVMREIVGRNKIDAVLTEERDTIEVRVKEEIQNTLNDYEAGVRILQVAIKEALPPNEVIKDFKDVQAARADRERSVEEANAYVNKVLPIARGQAVEMREQASGYKERVIAEAIGDASRFEKVYDQYAKAPDVTQKRIYLETLEKILATKNKLIISGDASKSGVLPYLRLDELSKKNNGGN